MQDLLKPLKTESLKEVFVSKFEDLILSGKLIIGQKLPSERELALQLGVSRPVVHEGLVDLAFKGLITLKPRTGAVVNDYRKEGSPEILNSLLRYQKGELDPKILRGILSMRILFEVETSRLAAKNRTEEQLKQFNELTAKEETIVHNNASALTEVDFQFHHLLALSSGNFIYPLLMNSMKSVYTNLSKQFFDNADVVPAVFRFHKEMVKTLEARNPDAAEQVMRSILNHGEKQFILMINGEK